MANDDKTIITLDELEIQVLVSHEPDPYGQGGFSSRTARIRTWDKRMVSLLKKARADRSEIAIRCSNVEVQGRVFKCTWGFGGFKAMIRADEIRLIKLT